MRIFVTGATGFVGNAIVKALLERKHEVLGLVRDARKAKSLEQSGVTLVVGDMLEPASYEHIVPTVDGVIHAAQYPIQGRFTKQKVGKMEQADILMTRTLAKACLQHGKKFVYTSSTLAYGDHGDQWITEQDALHAPPISEAHEQLAKEMVAMHREQGLRVIIIAPGWVYGPGGLFKQSFYDTQQKGRLAAFGAGKNYWSPIHVDDLATGYALAIESEAYGETFNVVDDQPLTQREIIDLFTDALGVKRVGSMPPWFLKILLGAPLVDSLVISFRIKNARAKQALGWQPRYSTFKDGIPVVVKQLTAR
ncbi:MAG: NAD-dependent epimerase/dehydratase family protein [Ktedonobacteraceae bacterium]